MMLANSYLTYQITTLFTVTSPEKEKKKKKSSLKKKVFVKPCLHCVLLPEDSSYSSVTCSSHMPERIVSGQLKCS